MVTQDNTDVQDQTAASVFGQLKATVDANETDDILEEDTPEDIIASADEPDPAPEPIDDELTPDDDELTDLLLTGRTKHKEFLWIDTDDDPDSSTTDTGMEFTINLGAERTEDSAAGNESVTDSDEQTFGEKQTETDAKDSITLGPTETDRSSEQTISESSSTETPNRFDDSESQSDDADDPFAEIDAAELFDDSESPTQSESGEQTPPEAPEPAGESESEATDSNLPTPRANEETDLDTTDDEDDQPGFFRRLLSKLNPF